MHEYLSHGACGRGWLDRARRLRLAHPDHPSQPSEFDRQWAMPWFSYVITSVQAGRAAESRSWRLVEDRSQFVEEKIQITARS